MSLFLWIGLDITVADTGFSRTGGVGLLYGLNNEVQFGHKKTPILAGFYRA